jgi:hypothetical protein
MRIFPGNLAPAATDASTPQEDAETGSHAEPVEVAAGYDSGWAPHVEPAGTQEVVDGDVVREIDAPVVVDGEEAPAEPA